MAELPEKCCEGWAAQVHQFVLGIMSVVGGVVAHLARVVVIGMETWGGEAPLRPSVCARLVSSGTVEGLLLKVLLPRSSGRRCSCVRSLAAQRTRGYVGMELGIPP